MDRRHHGLQNVEGKELLEGDALPAIGRVGLLEFFVLCDTQRVNGQSGQKKNTGICNAVIRWVLLAWKIFWTRCEMDTLHRICGFLNDDFCDVPGDMSS